jgi:hypothetical protein
MSRFSFPNWPFDCDITNRPYHLSRKDAHDFYCVGSYPCGPGVIYQFQSKPYSDIVPRGLREPIAIESPWPRRYTPHVDGHWSIPGGFRGVFSHNEPAVYCIEIPCPKALQWNLGRPLMIATVTGLDGDLAFAKKISEGYYVVSEDSEFYHDMIAHVTPFVHLDQKENTRRHRLKEVLDFYELWKVDIDPLRDLSLLHFCFGWTAESECYCDLPTIMMEIQNSTFAQDILFTRFKLVGRDTINKALYAAAGDFFIQVDANVPRKKVDRAAVDKFLLYEPTRLGVGYNEAK